MERIKFTTSIDAVPSKVWDVLWSDATYPQWTAGFGENSHLKTDWQEGSKVLFLGADDEGMVSRIVSIRPKEYVSFQHLAAYKNGVETADAEEMKDWAGTHENYMLQQDGQRTLLTLEQEVPVNFVPDFQAFWENALKKIKELAEN
jgi:uncharacterized protein YndB with AHSA1/START domain